MAYRLAKSLEVLRKQINEFSPNRKKISDGWIGNAEHKSRTSDHNPWIEDAQGIGVVTALDITHDPEHGVDSGQIAETLRKSEDPRIKYIISNGRICSAISVGGKKPWTWRRYTGKNPHDKHFHVSVATKPELYDSTSLWILDMQHNTAPPSIEDRVLKKGDKGDDVKQVQTILKIEADGKFGAATESAVKAFQRKHKLVGDGVVGAHTWEKLKEK